MNRAVALAIVLAPALAAAAPIAVPAGWTLDAAHSTDEVHVYAAPTPGATLTITGRTAAPGIDLLGAARAGALHEGAVEDDWQQHADNQHRQHEGLLHYHDPAAHALGTIHIVVAADATHAVAITADCWATEATTFATITPCIHALDTLDTEIPEATRVWNEADHAMPAPLSGAQPAISDGAHLPPMILPPPPPPPIDRRPMYLGALVVMFAVFSWWSRRRRLENDDNLQAIGRRRDATPVPPEDQDPQ